ncbi:hypothetical protein AK830_g6448 [Neonectria ditissima]|uniref:RNA polymerase II holoenzyme cyclin-like subunit n=1 Tax=Neonectria ditissima TaxID=78410 RepID=A0A0P7AQK4_9HYPO|nr:hypothetical protein AK830_g6448 [Neonectria ditissima]
MAPSNLDRPPNTTNGNAAARIGPHPGFISSSNQYTTELKLRRMLKDNGCDPARQDSYRLQGVQLIENVREYLQLPVRSFDTACTYFHKFRLNFRDAEYSCQDAALTCLFVACKVEDTIKKSREIIAAAYNVKNPDKPATPDDKIFEASAKMIICLERLVLETVGFDFRTRYPQKLLVKVVRNILGKEHGKDFFSTAYAMSIDMYKTFVPIKRTTFSMVMAVVELTALMREEHLDKVHEFAAKRRQYHRGAVMETMLDILDLYSQHYKSTKLGLQFDLNKMIDIKIRLNNDLEKAFEPRYLFHCPRCEAEESQPPTPTSTTAPVMSTTLPGDASGRRTARGQEGTVRFVFDPDSARMEQESVKEHFHEEFEEYEIEVEEPIPPPQHEGGHRGGYRARQRKQCPRGSVLYQETCRHRNDPRNRKHSASSAQAPQPCSTVDALVEALVPGVDVDGIVASNTALAAERDMPRARTCTGPIRLRLTRRLSLSRRRPHFCSATTDAIAPVWFEIASMPLHLDVLLYFTRS